MENDAEELIEFAFESAEQKFSGKFWARVLIILLGFQDNFEVTFRNWELVVLYGTVVIRSKNGQIINRDTMSYITNRSDLAGRIIAIKNGREVKFCLNHNDKH